MKYSLICADPAWEYGNTVSNGAATNHYGTMKLIDMKRLPVWDLAADDAVLAMWFTGTHTREAIELAEAWGFKVRTMKGFTWGKFNPLAEQHINKTLQDGGLEDFYDFLDLLNVQTRMNGGNYTRANTEDMLIATRGNGLVRQCASIKQVIYSPLGEHSQKPAEARFRLEKLYGDVPRIELFSRCGAPGWDHWGNQAESAAVELIPGVAVPVTNNREHAA
ncbi:MT-A70 family methyltransferase [Enterobacter quasiroggenkampii]|uniref:MT-A70 family methyltransferase n=1 Tax=Enterobacter quasiroggenkampii TaxID=2497436 RepID=UPI0039C013E4